MMSCQLSVIVVLGLISLSCAKIDPRNLRCLVCRTTFEELNKAVMAVDRKKMVDVGNFRMDATGNTMQDKIPAHRSNIYIADLIEGVCTKLNDYVRVHYKATGKLAVLKMMGEGGFMNPEFSKTTFVTDDDLNKSLEYYCERIFEENEEQILNLYKNRPHDDVMPDGLTEVCVKHAKYCDEWMFATEADTTWTHDMEEEYVKKYGPDPYGFGGMGAGGPGGMKVDMGSMLSDMPSLPDVDEGFDDEL